MTRTLYWCFALCLSGAGCVAVTNATTLEEEQDVKRPDAGMSAPPPVDAGPPPRADSGGPREAGGGDNSCKSVTVETELITPEILIVLDRSGSMAPNLNDTGTDRWAGSIQAVKVVTNAFDENVDFGLMTFPSFEPIDVEDPYGELLDSPLCAPGTLNVSVGTRSAQEIAATLDAMTPSGLTPTGATLEAALGILMGPEAADQQAIAPKYVLLVTDGDPNCSAANGGLTPLDPAAREETLAAIEALSAAGVQTFVVGYETAATNFAGQLDAMARAGGTGQTEHQSVATGTGLIGTLEEISRRAVSCSYQLDDAVDDPSYLLVTVDGRARTYNDASDGWTLGTNNRTVVLRGEACDAHQRGAEFRVALSCEVVQLI